MLNDPYGNMAVYQQEVAELQAQARQDRLAKEFRAAHKRERNERRLAARLEAAFAGTPRGPLAAVLSWFGLDHDARPAPAGTTTGRVEEPGCVAEAADLHPADPHPAGARP